MESWTTAQYREYLRTGKLPGEKKPKQSKYRNKRTPYKGRVYDSKREADRAAELDMLVAAGEEVAVIPQVPFLLHGGVVYKADFVILHYDGTYTIEDAKGVRTKEYSLKRRLMADKGLEIREV